MPGPATQEQMQTLIELMTQVRDCLDVMCEMLAHVEADEHNLEARNKDWHDAH